MVRSQRWWAEHPHLVATVWDRANRRLELEREQDLANVRSARTILPKQ